MREVVGVKQINDFRKLCFEVQEMCALVVSVDRHPLLEVNTQEVLVRSHENVVGRRAAAVFWPLTAVRSNTNTNDCSPAN